MIKNINNSEKISLNNWTLFLEEKKCNKKNSEILKIFDIDKDDNEKIELKNWNWWSIMKIFDKDFLVWFRAFEWKWTVDKKFFDENSEILITWWTCFFDDSSIKIFSECWENFSVLNKDFDKNFLNNDLILKNFSFENEKITSYETDTILRFFIKTQKILENLPEWKNIKINFELPVTSYLFYIYSLFQNWKISIEYYKKYFFEINKKKKNLKKKIFEISEELKIPVDVKISESSEILENIFDTKINFSFLKNFLKWGLKKLSDEEIFEIEYSPYTKFIEKWMEDLWENSLILQVDNLSETMIWQKFSSQNKKYLKEKNISVAWIYSFPSVDNLKKYWWNLYLWWNEEKSDFQKLSSEEIFSFYEENFSDEIKEILQK